MSSEKMVCVINTNPQLQKCDVLDVCRNVPAKVGDQR